jgi:hypothetical protein
MAAGFKMAVNSSWKIMLKPPGHPFVGVIIAASALRIAFSAERLV